MMRLLVRLPPIALSRRSLSVSSSKMEGTPSFPRLTTDAKGGFLGFVRSPSVKTMLMVALSGRVNADFTADMGCSAEEFSEGALHAIEVVSSHVAKEDSFDVLADQLTPSCLNSLQKRLLEDSASKIDRSSLSILEKDVFFSWIAHSVESKGIREVLFVTMSMPGIHNMRKGILENNKRFEEFANDLRARAPDNKSMAEEVEQFKSSLSNPAAKFRDSDFVVSNFRFVHGGDFDDDGWRIHQIMTREAKGLYTTPSYYRWKGRLGFYLRGNNFINVLRYDYATDLMLWLGLMLVILFSGANAQKQEEASRK